MDITLNKNFKIIKVKPNNKKLKKRRLSKTIEKPHTEKTEDEDEEFNEFINPDQSEKLKIY
ncbi:MAG: hypothetical protein CMJ25_27280 [Phycisphaerae bacterium]|nr:hypothetical protein [Phycisphaerae bacterium]|tara:strand:- start:430 stop:612 length:183 start_codon:yes stop_codon:yes gene_type:complete